MAQASKHPTSIPIAARVLALGIGLIAGALGAYGAFQMQAAIDGPASYLSIAAPVVAVTAALIPCLAEAAWQARQRVKAALWWLVLLPAAAVVFFGAAERVHVSKAGAEAERAAAHAAVTRARTALTEAKTKADRAEADAKAARKLPRRQCDDRCLARWDAEAQAARQRITQAQSGVTAAEAMAVAESPLRPPVWLLPAALDLVAFMCIWSALSVPVPQGRKPVKHRPRKPKAITRPPLKLVAANNN